MAVVETAVEPGRPHPSMPSSPTAVVSVPTVAEGGVPLLSSGLLGVLAAVPDPRSRRGVRHRVASVLAISVAAVLAGARAYTVIAELCRSRHSVSVVRKSAGSVAKLRAA